MTDDTSRCIACAQAMTDGDLYLPDADGGVVHATCLGPDRVSYTIDGRPLRDDEPIPDPYVWGRET